MKRSLLILFFLSAFFSAQSQEIKIKKDQVFVDDKIWLKSDGCGGLGSFCSLINLSGEEIIYMKFIKLEGVLPITNYNKTGDATYIEVKFLGMNRTVEFDQGYKKIIKTLFSAKVVNEDGTLNEEMVDRVVEKYGNEFSVKYNNRNTNTIIIKEEPKRSGVNINIGR